MSICTAFAYNYNTSSFKVIYILTFLIILALIAYESYKVIKLNDYSAGCSLANSII